jgi:hypothetical protein
MKSKYLMTIIIGAVILNSCERNRDDSYTITFDFFEDADGWVGDFADYPVGDEETYELNFAWSHLPAPLEASKGALMITGNNHSDDLFMFIKRKIDGLKPNATYSITFDVEFASNAPTNAIGVGGAPGEGVTMKVGAVIIQPAKIAGDNDYYTMNLDKGNQTISGTDMFSIGHIGVSDTSTVFTLINRNNDTHPFNFTSDLNGEIWVIIGTDSGYESTTTLYYSKIKLGIKKY